jgi:hypothetical protein
MYFWVGILVPVGLFFFIVKSQLSRIKRVSTIGAELYRSLHIKNNAVNLKILE